MPLYTHTHIHALISVIYLVLVSSLSYLLFSFVKSLLVGSTGVAECVPGFWVKSYGVNPTSLHIL